MKIVIVGAGEVGYHLAKLLSMEAHDIFVIDNSSKKLKNINSHLDVITAKGDGASIKVLKEVGVGSADLLVALTDLQNTNLTIAGISKRLGVKKTIARISNTEYLTSNELNFSEVGIDYMISPAQLAANEIETLVRESAFNDKFEFEKGALNILGAKITLKSPLIGLTVQQAKHKFEEIKFVVIALKREESLVTIIPNGKTVFESGDQVYFSVPKKYVGNIHTLVGKEKVGIKDVMIIGGGRIGEQVAENLCNSKIRVKLIEQNRDKAYDLSDRLKHTLIIHADGRNIDILEEESLNQMDAFIAVTGSSEANIMTSLVAKSKGVKKTIALVNNMNYIDISHNIGVDTLINKKILAASVIFRHVRKGKVLALANLHNVDAEVLEFLVRRNTKITEDKIKNINFPKDSVLGGVVRKGEAFMTYGEFQAQAGDRAIVFCLPSAIQEVEKLFNN